MKRLKPVKKIRQLRVNQRRFRKRIVLKLKRFDKHKKSELAKKFEINKEREKAYSNWQFESPKKYHPIEKRYGYVCISAPEICSIGQYPEEANLFFSALKDWGKLKLEKFANKYDVPRGIPKALDLTDTREITPAFAMHMVAHMSLHRRIRRTKYGTDFVSNWSEDVKKMLKDLGFFSVLGIKESEFANKEVYSIIPYEEVKATGVNKGYHTKELTKQLKELTGRDFSNEVPPGLGEAMINVGDHAYNKSQAFRYFWYVAFYEQTTRTVSIIVSDIGQGIPASMKKNLGRWPWVPDLAKKTDSELLAHAMEYGKSSTKIEGRGQGLYHMMQVITDINSDSKHLRIISAKAEIKFDGINLEAREIPFNLDGTLIEWKYVI